MGRHMGRLACAYVGQEPSAMKARNSATSAFVQCGGSVPASPKEGGASVAVAVGAGVRVGCKRRRLWRWRRWDGLAGSGHGKRQHGGK